MSTRIRWSKARVRELLAEGVSAPTVSLLYDVPLARVKEVQSAMPAPVKTDEELEVEVRRLASHLLASAWRIVRRGSPDDQIRLMGMFLGRMYANTKSETGTELDQLRSEFEALMSDARDVGAGEDDDADEAPPALGG